MRHVRTLLLVLAIWPLIGCSESGPSVTVAKLSNLDMDSFISLTEAIEIAQGEVPDGVAISAVLEVEDDDENEPPAFEVSFFVSGNQQIIAVEVDATTGDVLEVEVEEDGEDEDDDDDA